MPAVPVAVNYGNVLTEIQMVQFDADKICGIIKNMPKDGLRAKRFFWINCSYSSLEKEFLRKRLTVELLTP